MPRERRQNGMFVVLLLILAVVIWYGAVLVTGPNCATGVKTSFVLTPPPHWSCVAGYP